MSYKDDSRASTFNTGVHVTKAEYTGRVFFPSWDADKYVPTVFRPFGPTNDEQTEFLPWRFTTEEHDYSDWIQTLMLFRGGTRERVSFVANQFNEDGSKRDLRMNPSPAQILIEAWNRGQEEFTHWKALAEGGKGRAAAMPDRLQTFAAIQCAVLEHNGKEFYDNPVLPAIVLLGWSAMVALESEIDKEVEGYDGDPADANARFACGDLLSADGGKTFSVFNSKTAPGKKSQLPDKQGRVSWGNAGRTASKSKDHDFERPHYALTLADSEPLPRAEDGRILHVAQGLGWRPWFDNPDTGEEGILKPLSDDEQVLLLCRAFEDMPDLLAYAFEERGMLPQSFYDRQRLREANRKASESRTTAAPVRPAARPAAVAAAPAAAKRAAWGKPAALPPAALPLEEGETTAADAAAEELPPDDIPMEFPPEEQPAETAADPDTGVTEGGETAEADPAEPDPDPAAEATGETPEEQAARESADALNILQKRKQELEARKQATQPKAAPAAAKPAAAAKPVAAAVRPVAAAAKPAAVAAKPVAAAAKPVAAAVRPAAAAAKPVAAAVRPAAVGARPAVRPAARPAGQ